MYTEGLKNWTYIYATVWDIHSNMGDLLACLFMIRPHESCDMSHKKKKMGNTSYIGFYSRC